MRKYVILTDSCSDLTDELRKKFDIGYIAMSLRKGEKESPADLSWNFMPAHEFYESMKAGAVYKTAQVTMLAYEETFEKCAAEGVDVLSISCSSALSASYNASCLIAKEVMERHPEMKIICVDSLSACMGLGLIAVTASRIRAEGKSIEETSSYLENHKLEMQQWATADSLEYLKKAGRVSKAAAFFGGMLQVKPIIISDRSGCNVSIEKTKGRKASIRLIIERFKEHYQPDHPYQTIAISHCDCPEEVQQIQDEITEFVKGTNVEIYVQYMGPIIGATLGPGGLSLFAWGDAVTFDSKAGK